MRKIHISVHIIVGIILRENNLFFRRINLIIKYSDFFRIIGRSTVRRSYSQFYGFLSTCIPLQSDLSVMECSQLRCSIRIPCILITIRFCIAYGKYIEDRQFLITDCKFRWNIRMYKCGFLTPCRTFMIRIDCLNSHMVSTRLPSTYIKCLIQIRSGISFQEITTGTVCIGMSIHHISLTRSTADANLIRQVFTAAQSVATCTPTDFQFTHRCII